MYYVRARGVDERVINVLIVILCNGEENIAANADRTAAALTATVAYYSRPNCKIVSDSMINK